MSGSLRTITVKGRVWNYRIGRSYIVANAEDNNEKRLGNLSEVTGLEWDVVEKGMWKGWLHITPKTIADWLKTPPTLKVKEKFKHTQRYCPECNGDGYVYKDGEKVDCDACTVLEVDFTKDFTAAFGGEFKEFMTVGLNKGEKQ